MPRRRSGSTEAGRTDNGTDLARLVREGRGSPQGAVTTRATAWVPRPSDLSRSSSLPGAAPPSRGRPRGSTPQGPTGSTRRLTPAAEGPRSHTRGPSACAGRPWRTGAPGSGPSARAAAIYPWPHALRPGRPQRRGPHVQRGGGAPAPRGAAAPGGRRRGACRTRSSASTTGRPTPPRCCCSGCAASGRRCASCGCGPTPGTRPPSRPGSPAPGAVGGHHRRRPAGPARGDRRDARRRPRPGRRRGLRGALGPLHRHGVQAAHRPGLLPVDPGDVRRRRPRRRRRLPADVAGHGGCRERASRARPGAAPRRAGAGLPERVGRLRAGGTGRGRLEVPAGQDDPALDRRRHRVLDRPAALRDLAGPARRVGGAGRAASTPSCAMLLGNTLPGWTSTVVIVAAVGAVQLLALGILGEYVGRTYAALQARPRTSSPTTRSTWGAGETPRAVRPGSDRRPRRPTWSSSARAGPSGPGRAASGSRCRSRHRSRTRRRR